MSLSFNCTVCDQLLVASEKHAGWQVKCPTCRQSILIPLPLGPVKPIEPEPVLDLSDCNPVDHLNPSIYVGIAAVTIVIVGLIIWKNQPLEIDSKTKTYVSDDQSRYEHRADEIWAETEVRDHFERTHPRISKLTIDELKIGPWILGNETGMAVASAKVTLHYGTPRDNLHSRMKYEWDCLFKRPYGENAQVIRWVKVYDIYSGETIWSKR